MCAPMRQPALLASCCGKLCVPRSFGTPSLLPAAEDRQMENQPRNILEEIVWHKAVEVGRWPLQQDYAVQRRWP